MNKPYKMLMPLYILSIFFIEAVFSTWYIWYYDFVFIDSIIMCAVILILMTIHYTILWRATSKSLVGTTLHMTFLFLDIIMTMPLLIITIADVHNYVINVIFIITAEAVILTMRVISSILYFIKIKKQSVYKLDVNKKY